MVHQLSAKERSPYLKCAVCCPSEAIMSSTVANDKKHGIYPKQSRKPKQSRNSLTQSKPCGRNSNQSISSEANADFD